MTVVVETPKWSFVKFRWDGSWFVVDYFSPLPTLFNYGFVEGEVGGDGMPLDALVLGGKLSQGMKVDYSIAGKVQFIDNGQEDDKVIYSKTGRLSRWNRAKIGFFFKTYVLFKRLWGIKCKYKGILQMK